MPYRFTDPAKYPYRPGSLFLGLDPATNRETGIKTEIHAITIGGSGSGKGAALLVPNARRWPHNLVCIDPKGENAILSWEAREAMGQRVVIIDPFEEIPRGRVPEKYKGHANPVPDRLRVSVNPLAGIKAESARARAALSAIGNGLVVVHDAKHMEWTEGARALLAGLAAYVCTIEVEHRNFGTLRSLLMMPDDSLAELAGDMKDNMAFGGLIREAGTTLAKALEPVKSMEKDFLGLARRASRWLDDDAISAALVGSNFKMSELKSGEVSLFLVLPADYLADYSGFLRLFVKAALNAMGQPGEGARCLFLLDEFYSLGKLDELTEAAGRMRSYGVQLWPFMQGISQLHALYGKDEAQTFLTNAGARIFLGNDKDTVTLDYISYALGKLTAPEVAAPHVPPSSAHLDSLVRDIHKTSSPPAHDPKHPILSSIGKAFHDADLEQTAKKRASLEIERARHAERAEAARIEYDHQMRQVDKPRMTPDELAMLIGKNEQAGEDVARSMIVLAQAGDVLKLRLAPYFVPRDASSTAATGAELGAGPFQGGAARGLWASTLAFWLGPVPLITKIVIAAATFCAAAILVSRLPFASQAMFTISTALAVIILPQFLHRRFGTDWVLMVAFALGFGAGFDPERAAAPITAGLPPFIAAIVSGALMTAIAWVARYGWRSFRDL